LNDLQFRVLSLEFIVGLYVLAFMKDKSMPGEKEKSRVKEFFRMNEVFGYFFRSKDTSRPSNINIKMMHGINKISIIIFLAGVFYLIFKLLIKPLL